jgi:hypothetical protein
MVDDANLNSGGFGDAPDNAVELTLAEGGAEAISRLIEQTRADPSAPFDVVSDLTQLKRGNLAAFMRLREQLKRARCRVGELDKAVDAENGEQRALSRER